MRLSHVAWNLGGQSLIRTESTSPSETQYAMLLLAIVLPVQAMSASYRRFYELQEY